MEKQNFTNKPALQSRGHILKMFLTLTLLACFHLTVSAQRQPYVYETDPLILKNLEEWQDLKFGFMMHWGAYSIWGVIESWSLSSEPMWVRTGPYANNYEEYKKHYELLPRYFNPIRFNPDKWAKAAKDAGMKYVVFTTKHHDGFCMYDTRYTDYKITDPSVPFHVNPKANVVKEVFQSFRNEGMSIGAYFSKPDWHHPDYWAPEWATPDRNVNYNTRQYPERWQRFKDFTYNQIEELMTGYGKVDILWLDGGQVRPFPSEEAEKQAAERRLWNQDIDMARIAKMARSHQPGLLVVDRTVGGIYENYRTPEQEIPEEPLSYPWESCITITKSWSWTPGDVYKPTHQIIHMLVDIVAKGGNYLLNFGPGPDGDMEEIAYRRLAEIGQWMKINGEAIYSTRSIAPYKQDKVCYTSKKDGTLYGIYLADENETMPASLLLKGITAPKNAKITLLGVNGNCTWKQTGEGVLVTTPASALKSPPSPHAWTVKIRP
jgi:alpha-L-fucosidase